MRTKKRLKWTRDETPSGLVVYRAKRKTETAVIVPQPEGGYAVSLATKKCKKRTIVGTVAEAREAAEVMRASQPRRNPLFKMPSPIFLWGAGAGAVAALGVAVWIMKKSAAATAAATPAPTPAQLPPGATLNVTQTAQLLAMPTQTLTWTGGTLLLTLPLGATSWASVNNSTVPGVSATGSLQLPDPPIGSYTIDYVTPGLGGEADTTNTTVVSVVAAAGAVA